LDISKKEQFTGYFIADLNFCQFFIVYDAKLLLLAPGWEKNC